MKPFIDIDIENYAKQYTQAENDLLLELEQDTMANMHTPHMISGRLSGRFLKILTMISRAKFVVEVGMFTGYSALSIAEGLPEDGEIVTCEIKPVCIEFAKRYFARSPHGHKISVRTEGGLATLQSIDRKIDLAFIDADKGNYPQYYELILAKMDAGGIIVIDNCLWSGRVLDPKNDKDQGICKVNEIVAQDPRVENVILTVRDGLNIIRKK